MAHRMTQGQFYAGVVPVQVFCWDKPSKGPPPAGGHWPGKLHCRKF